MKLALKLLAVAGAFLLLFFGLQRLLMPKYMNGVYDGALIGEYYAEEKNHQVIFIGDCEVYENFSPVRLWKDYGITSYIRGGPQQLIWQSYYLLEDTLRYETPDVVVFNVLAMKYNVPQSEAYNRLNLDGMRWSAAKAEAIKASMLPEESFLSYLFPLLRFHERWQELTPSDISHYFSVDQVGHNGYLMRNDVKPLGVIPEGPRLNNYRFGANSYLYLEKMAELCRENGIELVLIKAPTIYPHWYEEWDAQMEEFAGEHGLLYINFLDHIDGARLDFSTDTYDAGLHLNLRGAEKLSHYFGRILQERFALADLRGDEAISAAWAEKTQKYEAMRDQQLEELHRQGKITSFTFS